MDVSEIPFVAVSRLVNYTGILISIICEHPQTLKEILTSNRLYDQCCIRTDCGIRSNWPRSCRNLSCVYEIACECGNKYVEKTERPLTARITEHIWALVNPSVKSYVDVHLQDVALLHTAKVSQKSPSKFQTFAWIQYGVKFLKVIS